MSVQRRRTAPALPTEPGGCCSGPLLVEATHGKLGFTAPLSAMFFAHHVLWPQGFGGHYDVISAGIGCAAAAALFRFKVGMMPLPGACAATGLVATWIEPLLR